MTNNCQTSLTVLKQALIGVADRSHEPGNDEDQANHGQDKSDHRQSENDQEIDSDFLHR